MGRKRILVTFALCVAVVTVAVLALMPSQSCSIIYDSNSEACSGSTRDGERHASGGDVRIKDCGFSRPGYTFSCWSVSPDGTGATYSPGDWLYVDGDVRLYAQWLNGEFIQSGDELVVDEAPDICGDRYSIDASEFASFKTLTVMADAAEEMAGVPVDLMLPGDVHARFGADVTEAMASVAEASGGPLSITVDDCPTGLTAMQIAVVGDCDVYRITVEADAAIKTLGGDVEFVLPYGSSGTGIAEVWCVSDDGSVEVMRTEVEDGAVSFITSHLSVFAVMDVVPVHCSVRPADGQDVPAEVLAAFSVSVSSIDPKVAIHTGNVRVGSTVSVDSWGSFDGYACALEVEGASMASGGYVVTGKSLEAAGVVSRVEGGFPVTVVQPSMGGTISAQGTAAEGSFVSVTARPEEGYALIGIRVSCEDEFQTVDPTLSGFVMPSCPVEVTASFGSGSVMHSISLPADTKMYAVTASKSSVEDGGSFRIQLTVSLGYVKNASFALRVNGSMLDLDSLDRCTVSSVHSDQTVTVEGIENAVSHGVSIPSDQTGYDLSVDRDRVPEEESYTMMFSIREGYRQGDGFSVCINGSPVDISSGSCKVDNVLALQRIDVEGVELTPYRVSAGANTSVLCGGVPVFTATMEDVLTVIPSEGYVLPATYATAVGAIDTVSSVDSGYMVSGDTTFPSVWSVTAGRNTSVSAGFVVSGESVVVSADAGYEMPVDYYDYIMELDSISSVDSMWCITNDVILLDIYKIEFVKNYTESKEISEDLTKYAVSGKSVVILPTMADISMEHYTGLTWFLNNIRFESTTVIVNEDTIFTGKWNIVKYNVTFGTNLVITVPGKQPVVVNDIETMQFAPYKSFSIGVSNNNAIFNGFSDIEGLIYDIESNTYSVVSDVIIPSVYYLNCAIKTNTVSYALSENTSIQLSTFLPADFFTEDERESFQCWVIDCDDVSTRIDNITINENVEVTAIFDV